MVARPTHFEIYGDRPELLSHFYRDVLGWHLQKAEGVDYWRISIDGADSEALAGGLTFRPDFDVRGWLHFVEVASVDDCITMATWRQGTVLKQKSAVPKTAWYAVIADPAGNPFGIWQPDTRAMPLPTPD